MFANDVLVVFRGKTWSPVMLRTEEDPAQHSTSLKDIKTSAGIQDPIILNVKGLPGNTIDKAEV